MTLLTEQLDRKYRAWGHNWRTTPPSEAKPISSMNVITNTDLTNNPAPLGQAIRLCSLKCRPNMVLVLKKVGVKGTAYYTNVGSVPLEFQPYDIPTSAFIDTLSFEVLVGQQQPLDIYCSRTATEPTPVSNVRIFDLFDLDDAAPLVVEGDIAVEIVVRKLIASFAPGTGVPPLAFPVPAGGFLLESRLMGYLLPVSQLAISSFPSPGVV